MAARKKAASKKATRRKKAGRKKATAKADGRRRAAAARSGHLGLRRSTFFGRSGPRAGAAGRGFLRLRPASSPLAPVWRGGSRHGAHHDRRLHRARSPTASTWSRWRRSATKQLKKGAKAARAGRGEQGGRDALREIAAGYIAARLSGRATAARLRRLRPLRAAARSARPAASLSACQIWTGIRKLNAGSEPTSLATEISPSSSVIRSRTSVSPSPAPR